MSRRQWAWIVGLSIGLAFVLAFGKLAYDRNALDAQTAAGGSATLWGVTGLAAALAAFGIIATIYETSNVKLLEAGSSFRGRMALVVAVAALAGFILVAALRAQPPRNWRCTLKTTSIAKPDTVRCGRGTFAQMRTFTIAVQRREHGAVEPVLRARATDRPRASVALEAASSACTSRGPDWPAFGESQLPLPATCGTGGGFEIHVRVCDTSADAPARSVVDLAAAAALEMWEREAVEAVTCR